MSKLYSINFTRNLIFFLAFFVFAEIFKSILGSYVIIVPVAVSLLIATFFIERRKISITILFYLLVFGIWLAFQYFFIRNPSIPIIFLSIAMAVFIARILNEVDIKVITKNASTLGVLLSLGLLVSLAYSIIGGSPFFEIERVNSNQILHVYPGSLALHTNYGIRYSSIYDEPGSVAFVLACILIMRARYHSPNFVDLFIIMGGLISSSAAFAVFLVLYLFNFLTKRVVRTVNKLQWLGMVILLLLLIIIIPETVNAFSNRLIQASESSNPLTLINRYTALQNAFYLLNSNDYSYLFGINYPAYSELLDQGIKAGENPLSPLLFYGVVTSFIYYLLITRLIFSPNKNNPFLSIGFAALLFQRPYIFDFGYIFLIMLVYLSLNRK